MFLMEEIEKTKTKKIIGPGKWKITATIDYKQSHYIYVIRVVSYFKDFAKRRQHKRNAAAIAPMTMPKISQPVNQMELQ